MSSVFYRCFLTTLLLIFSILASAADTATSPTNPNEPSVFLKSLNSSSHISTTNTDSNTVTIKNTPQPLERLQQLQNTQSQLQDALTGLQRQSNQLQTSLSALNQQLGQPLSIQQQNPEEAQRLAQLHKEHEQIQNNLTTLRQQQIQLQARILALNQQLTQLHQALLASSKTAQPEVMTPVVTQAAVNTIQAVTPVTTMPVAAKNPPPSATTKIATPHKVESTRLSLQEKILSLDWMQDPATMLRIGAGFIALALLLMLILFWPKKKKKQIIRRSDLLDETNETSNPIPEYDFMSTQDAIPNRLDLARGYIEMGKYTEAREAIEPVFEKGNPVQQTEASHLLQKIEQAESEI